MKYHMLLLTGLIAITISSCTSIQEEKHLFILSGQSNMQRLLPETSFTPTVEAAFGKTNVIVVKDAQGGQPIRRWYKHWKPLEGDTPQTESDLYDSLMVKVNDVIKNENLSSVTFIWMQGERDAREKFGAVYYKSLEGLYNQISNDLNRTDVNFIIGRLSDFDLENTRYPHWQMVREAQVKLAESQERFEWINTDDLNDGFDKKGNPIQNDLHMSETGYITMGKRFADTAIKLVKRKHK